mmetsp:Transcript_537/g.1056  ORF Transcript_537/g.1056 Transcript_537/m.1056 type:complete len:210 (+) Transcript_537:705-1334(+)
MSFSQGSERASRTCDITSGATRPSAAAVGSGKPGTSLKVPWCSTEDSQTYPSPRFITNSCLFQSAFSMPERRAPLGVASSAATVLPGRSIQPPLQPEVWFHCQCLLLDFILYCCPSSWHGSAGPVILTFIALGPLVACRTVKLTSGPVGVAEGNACKSGGSSPTKSLAETNTSLPYCGVVINPKPLSCLNARILPVCSGLSVKVAALPF